MADLKQYPRSYLETAFDPTDYSQIAACLDELESRQLNDLATLRQWCLDVSEFRSAVREEGVRRYIDHTCYTEDEEIGQRYLTWVEEFQPQIKPRLVSLERRLVDSEFAHHLPEEEYGTWARSARNTVEIFREENVPIETEIEKLQSEYDTILGSITVQFDGEERTLPQMGRYLEEPDRTLRERAYRTTQARFARDSEAIELVLDQLLGLRDQAARNADFDTYRELCYRQLERFDYGVHECETFHDAVEAVATPLLRAIHERRAAEMGLDQLRPWDMFVDPKGRPPLRPFENVGELSAGCRMMFDRVDPSLSAHFDHLIDNGLLDLESRVGKAPGGYQETYPEQRVPFIFMNAVGTQGDVETLLHEGGHAFHALECRDEPLSANRDYPIEFAEVASMSMELLATPHLDVFYPNPADARRAKLEFLENMVSVFPWVATIDAFQHWLYTNPGHTRDQRFAAWRATYERFATGIVDYTGLDDAFEQKWFKQLHIFVVPFYYIEYAIAQLGALQVWLNYREDPALAIEMYRQGLSLGGKKRLPELFEATGIQFDFSHSMLQRLLGAVADEIESLREETPSHS